MVRDQVTKDDGGAAALQRDYLQQHAQEGQAQPGPALLLPGGQPLRPRGRGTALTVVAHSSEKIIVRASNPGQFENDIELSWQKGHTLIPYFTIMFLSYLSWIFRDVMFNGLQGRVGINTDRPEESLVVHGNIKVTGHILQPSDLRAKYDIHELDTREQLRNVSNLRIVRYRYPPRVRGAGGDGPAGGHGGHRPGGAARPSRGGEGGGGRQADRRHVIQKLLVVNKERIFMENVGAVKELCKVTDNLETRIDELERINRKLSSIRRKDSLKSDLSRMSSVRSHERHRCHRSCEKQRSGKQASSCSSHFIQSSIFVLVVIMACW
ncbi:myelin regulatory factor [Caerostris extrusa]|uniref:Myelin regulatory factor n=1 Tax=Caerostris extrusa TaxID=172846 RepID=A0AAV4QZB9_CAEEX|nr:myelin regulatory factor [Caerostris extrusa]